MGGQYCLIRLSQVISYIVFVCDTSFTSSCLISQHELTSHHINCLDITRSWENI